MNEIFTNTKFKKITKKIELIFALFFIMFEFNSCYSVFSGGTGGRIADSESTSTPKAGIANVDVYAYTDSGSRDSDFNSWTEGKVFTPSASYYAHTITDSNGEFTLSKLMWKEYSPDFGRDGDISKVYLLYYHENYGLTKGSTLIVSDSVSDSVYQELTATRKTTLLNISLIDVSTNQNATSSVNVKVEVPQITESRIYEQTITGSGTISVSYPRFITSDETKTENKPEIILTYEQSSDEITWKACYNEDNSEKNFAFKDDSKVTKTIGGDSFSINLYGKSTRIYVPVVSGQYKNSGDESDDGVEISMKCNKSNSEEFDLDCGQVFTQSQTVGTSGTQTHGNFSGLGTNVYWQDESYTGKYVETKLKFFVNGSEIKTMENVRSDTTSINVQLEQGS